MAAGAAPMPVKPFKFKRITGNGGFPWMAHPEIEAPASIGAPLGVSETLADVKGFATRVRWREMT